MRRLFATGLFWIWISILVIILDRVSKMWVVSHLQPFEPLTLTPFLNFTLAYNKGAAFSFLNQASGWQNIALGTLAVIVALVILNWLYKLNKNERWLAFSLNLILGGALGNAWDRYIYGYVIDFIDFHLWDWHFAIFNIADSAICIGSFMLILHWLFVPAPQKSR